jgi:hypothetical protein
MAPAEPRYFKILWKYLQKMDPPLEGPDAARYEEAVIDLVTLKPCIYRDPISRFIARKLLDPFHHTFGRLLGKLPNSRLNNWFTYSAVHIQKIASVFTIFLASILLVAMTTALYFIKSMTTRLLVIASFSMTFALFLSIFDSEPMAAITTTSTLVSSRNDV